MEHRRRTVSSAEALCSRGAGRSRLCGGVERARGGSGALRLARETVRKMLRYSVPPGYRPRASRSGVRSFALASLTVAGRPDQDGGRATISSARRNNATRPSASGNSSWRLRSTPSRGRLPDRQDDSTCATSRRWAWSGDVPMPPRRDPPLAQRCPGRFRRSTGGHSRAVECKAHYLVVASPASSDRSGVVKASSRTISTEVVLRPGLINWPSLTATSTGCPKPAHFRLRQHQAGSGADLLGDAAARQRDAGVQRAPVVTTCSEAATLRALPCSKGNDKGKGWKGMVGYARRNFFVPVPRFPKLGGLERRRRASTCRDRERPASGCCIGTPRRSGSCFARDRDALTAVATPVLV